MLYPSDRLIPSLLLILVFLPWAAGASAEEPHLADWMDDPFSVPAAELMDAAQAVPPPDEADIFLLLDKSTHRFDTEGRHFRRHLSIYRVMSQAGADNWATTSAVWAPWHQARPSIRARVLTSGGGEHRLDPSTLSEAPVSEDNPEIFDDRRILQAPLPAVEVGSLVIEEVVIEETEPYFGSGSQHRDYLISNHPLYRGRVVLQAPISVTLRYGLRLADDVQPQRELVTEDGVQNVRLTFDYGDREAAEASEPNLPYHLSRFPSVIFSTAKDWQAVATAYDTIVDDALDGAELTEILVGFPVGGSRQEQIDFLLAQVQEAVRYTGLELGSASIIPVSPKDILERRFGDCKDQATLLVGLLREVDIPAHVALLRADLGEDVEPELPGLGAFNHAIVFVPGERPVWIDPTHPHARAGELPLQDQGRWALVADDATQELRRTPVSNSVENRIVETRHLFLRNYGDGKVVETTQYFGSFDRHQRSTRVGSTQSDHEEAYTSYIEEEYMATSLESSEETPIDDLSQPFTLTLTALGAQRASTDLTEGAVALTYGDLFGEIPQTLLQESESPREGDFVFHNPFVKEWRYRIHLPPGFAPRQLPESKDVEVGSMRYEERFEIRDGVVHADLRLDSGLRRLTPEQFETTREALDELGQTDITVLYFDHQGAAHLASGRSREAVDIYLQLAEEHTDDPVHRVRLSKALLDLGMGEEAQQQARRATEADPSSALAHWALGFSLSHDAIGRLHGPGFDLDGALEALSQAHELDPSNPLFHAELAILLDYNADGERYGPGADLDRAIEVYQAWREEFERPGLDDNLLHTLYRAEKWEALKKLATDLPDGAKGKEIWRLTAVTALEGADAAMREANRLGKDRRSQAQLLAEVGNLLMGMGRFQEAGQLMQKIAHSSDNPASTRRQAEILMSVRPVDEVELSKSDPATPILKFFALVLRSDIDLEPVRDLFYPREDMSFLDLEETEELPDLLRQGLQANGLHLNPEDLGALILATLEARVEGDDTIGYRVELSSKLPSVSLEQVSFVQLWQDEYRLITADEGDFAPIADAALRHLEAGRLDAARQWLDWARELLPSPNDGDPLVRHAFLDAWPGGSRVSTPDSPEAADAQIRQAALVLKIMEDEGYEDTVTALKDLLAAQPDEATEHMLRHALFLAHYVADDWDGLNEQAQWMHQVHPNSNMALNSWVASLEATDQRDTLAKLAEDRLADDGNDALAQLILAELHLRGGDLEAATERFRKAIEDPDEDRRAMALNTLAWILLFLDAENEEILPLAQQSADLDGYQRYSILHTLAMVYADKGQPLEAIQVLLAGIQRRSDDALEDADWLVVARIAQSYGLTERAREIYQRLEEPEEPGDHVSSWHLAQLRLAELGN